MKKEKPLKLEIEIVVAFLEANLRTGKPTIQEVIGYLKRKYNLFYPEKIIDIEREEHRY